MVTIIMPSLNVAHYIEKCIASAVNQTLKNIEIICVDAGSTDGTVEILKRYEESDSRVQLVHSDRKSYGYQVNLGMDRAHGKYMAILETDDYVMPDMYEKLCAIAEQTGVDYVKCDYSVYTYYDNGRRWKSDGKAVWTDTDVYGHVSDKADIDSLEYLDVNVWNAVFRMDFMRSNGIRVNETPGAAYQDVYLSYQIHAYAKSAYYLKEQLYCYTMNRAESSTYSKDTFRYIYEEHQKTFSDKKLMAALGERALCRRMWRSVVYEIDALLPRLNYDLDDEHFAKYIPWYKETFLNPKAKAYLADIADESVGGRGMYNGDFEEAVAALKEYNEEQARLMKRFTEPLHGKNVVVYGAGSRLRCALMYAYEADADDVVVTDSAEALWGTQRQECEVIPPDTAFERYHDYIYFISVKFFVPEIEERLLNAGIPKENILVMDIE
jgi:glycosyltransferase involved in cell wall biosynthesis